jgi:hypothetical protein
MIFELENLIINVIKIYEVIANKSMGNYFGYDCMNPRQREQLDEDSDDELVDYDSDTSSESKDEVIIRHEIYKVHDLDSYESKYD